MVQEIVSYAIIGSAFGFVAAKSARFFVSSAMKKQKKSKCASCSADCVLRNMTLNSKEKCPDRKELDLYL